MAIVSKADPNSESGDGPKAPGEGAVPQGGDAPHEVRHNLPLKASPVVGRKAEMQRVVVIFDRVRREGRPRRVEIVGKKGVGASTVAVELARRAGHRFPGGAWYVNLSMGADVAWATLGALRDDRPVKNLAAAARAARERLGEEPKALLILDAVTSAAEATAALPPTTENSADVFLVSETPLGTVDADQVCEVSPVPRHGARRIALSMLRHGQPDAKPPAVRTLDGLAVTASLAARAALAYQGKQGPFSFEDVRSALQRVVQLVARHPTALELLLLASVAHPVSLPVDSLLGGLNAVRKGRGAEATPDDAGSGIMWLAHAGIIEPLDERRFSMHPLVQEAVHTMASTPADLDVAREAIAAGLCAEAEASITDEGVDLPRAAPHQLRHLAKSMSGDAKARVEATIAKLDAALGVNGADAAARN